MGIYDTIKQHGLDILSIGRNCLSSFNTALQRDGGLEPAPVLLIRTRPLKEAREIFNLVIEKDKSYLIIKDSSCLSCLLEAFSDPIIPFPVLFF
ncbi:hypothetical protein Swol_1218 [Syntrophomonas wolfei subsp. wolfei str. Goettingen G311]|uniref:Uncharacterized protein n=1 Tax=Syntrophomonas wolfei subsp. wolfei (strain DSM 2245B / Goettingen) TaxID=335541 RepID=Q0AXM7_SYNWW|nr:hypothetical protein Swol_1218 [Syntrophomonas wolfei subsp. wolfei str. Goettingen G311]